MSDGHPGPRSGKDVVHDYAARVGHLRPEEPPPACGLPRPSADTICILPEDHVSAWHQDVNGQVWL